MALGLSVAPVDRPEGTPRGTQAEIILLTTALRLQWMEALALDRELSHTAFRVACVIAKSFNGKTGETFLSQDRIARLIDMTVRSVQIAIAELERRGYMQIVRGGPDDDRRCHFYRPAFRGQRVAATSSCSALGSFIEQLWKQSAKPASPIDATTGEADFAFSDAEKAKSGAAIGEAHFAPTYKNLPKESRGRARGVETVGSSPAAADAQHSGTVTPQATVRDPALFQMLAKLGVHFGATWMRHWIDPAKPALDSTGSLVLVARNTTARSWLKQSEIEIARVSGVRVVIL